MEELLFDNIMNGESLVKDILKTDGVSSIRDNNGKSYKNKLLNLIKNE